MRTRPDARLVIPTRIPALLALLMLLLVAAPAPTAEATLRVCFLPVDANCFWWDGTRYVHCDVYVAAPGLRPSCMQLDAFDALA